MEAAAAAEVQGGGKIADGSVQNGAKPALAAFGWPEIGVAAECYNHLKDFCMIHPMAGGSFPSYGLKRIRSTE